MTERICNCGCGGKTTKYREKYREYISGHNSHGSNHPQWKGGRVAVRRNAIMVIEKDHPRASKAGYVFEHILVAEKSLGRYLPVGSVIHHVDGNPSNNANCNLIICEDEAYHRLIHQRTRALMACGHATWRKCSYCKKYDDPKNLRIYGAGRPIFHLECSRKYAANRRKQRISIG